VEVDRGRPGALAGRSLRPELPPAENPGIKCVFGWEFRVYKPYSYGGLTWSRIWAFWLNFERAGWIHTKKFDRYTFRLSGHWETQNFGNFWNFRPKLKTRNERHYHTAKWAFDRKRKTMTKTILCYKQRELITTNLTRYTTSILQRNLCNRSICK
jgi:hypothetical protein